MHYCINGTSFAQVQPIVGLSTNAFSGLLHPMMAALPPIAYPGFQPSHIAALTVTDIVDQPKGACLGITSCGMMNIPPSSYKRCSLAMC